MDLDRPICKMNWAKRFTDNMNVYPSSIGQDLGNVNAAMQRFSPDWPQPRYSMMYWIRPNWHVYWFPFIWKCVLYFIICSTPFIVTIQISVPYMCWPLIDPMNLVKFRSIFMIIHDVVVFKIGGIILLSSKWGRDLPMTNSGGHRNSMPIETDYQLIDSETAVIWW